MSWLISEIPAKLSVEELVVRRYDVNDALSLSNAIALSIDELSPWMPWATFEPLSIHQRESLILGWGVEWNEKSNFTMGIFEDETCVGSTGLHLRGGEGELEIGYWVSTPHTGRRIASRVVSRLIDVAFSCPEVHTVEIAHDVANEKSQRIPVALGMSVCREYQRPRQAPGENGNTRVWSVVRPAWNRT
jgi:ribosomal-protein-serine acetyltransferase